MLNVLNNIERQRVNNHFSGEDLPHPLLEACCSAFGERAAKLEEIKASYEDVFRLVAWILDCLSNRNEPLTQRNVDDLWNEILMQVREWQDSTLNDRKVIADTVFRIVRKLLCHHWDTYYCDVLYNMFCVTINRESANGDKEEQRRFQERLSEHSEEISDWINNHYQGHLSEEVENVVKGESLFQSAVVNPKNAIAIIQQIHQLMEGKERPKDVMMPIRAAMDAGVIRRPKSEEFYNEFGTNRIKGKSSIDDYTNPEKEPYKGADFEAMKDIFIKINNNNA